MNRINEIRERASKATKGEWMVVVKGNTVQSQAVVTDSGINVCSGISPKRNDADFIAHSKFDIEYLLSEIDRLNKIVEANKTVDEANECQHCRLGIKAISMKFPTTHEYGGTWWTESVRIPKYCPMCGRKLKPEGKEGGQHDKQRND